MPCSLAVFTALFSELWQTSSNARNLIDFFFLFRITHLELVRLNVGVGDDFFFLHFASRQLGFITSSTALRASAGTFCRRMAKKMRAHLLRALRRGLLPLGTRLYLIHLYPATPRAVPAEIRYRSLNVSIHRPAPALQIVQE